MNWIFTCVLLVCLIVVVLIAIAAIQKIQKGRKEGQFKSETLIPKIRSGVISLIIWSVVWAIVGTIFQIIDSGEIILGLVITWAGVGGAVGLGASSFEEGIVSWAGGGAIAGAGGEMISTGTVGIIGVVLGIIAGVIAGAIVHAIDNLFQPKREFDSKFEFEPKAKLELTEEEREQKFLELLAKGLSILRISGELGISVAEGRSLKSDLLKKYGVESETELLDQAKENGLLPSGDIGSNSSPPDSSS